MRSSADRRRGWCAFGLTVSAFSWGVGLVAAAFVAPYYRTYTEGTNETGTFHSQTSSTLAEADGSGAVVAVALPALLTLVVWFALHRKCSRGSRRWSDVAWWIIGLLGVFSLISGFSVGAFVLPVFVLLAVAAAITPDPPTKVAPSACLPGRT